MGVLRINNLSKSFGSKKAVDGLSLEVEAGDIFGLFGPKGSGKSLALRAAAGVMPYTGDILINGVNMAQNPLYCKSQLAYLPNAPIAQDYLTGLQYFNFVTDIFDVQPDLRRDFLERNTEHFGLAPFLNKLISSYPPGPCKLLALFAALAHQPTLLILDEPFAGLDADSANKLSDILYRQSNNGLAILLGAQSPVSSDQANLASQANQQDRQGDPDRAEALCNKLIFMTGGKAEQYLEQEITPEA